MELAARAGFQHAGAASPRLSDSAADHGLTLTFPALESFGRVKARGRAAQYQPPDPIGCLTQDLVGDSGGAGQA